VVGEIHRSAVDSHSGTLETQRLQSQLNALGLGYLGLASYWRGLVFHYRHGSFRQVLDDIATARQSELIMM